MRHGIIDAQRGCTSAPHGFCGLLHPYPPLPTLPPAEALAMRQSSLWAEGEGGREVSDTCTWAGFPLRRSRRFARRQS